MRIVRKYLLEIDKRIEIALFDEDIEGKTEAEILTKVQAMARDSFGSVLIKQTRLYVSDAPVVSDEEVHAMVQAELDNRRGNQDTIR